MIPVSIEICNKFNNTISLILDYSHLILNYILSCILKDILAYNAIPIYLLAIFSILVFLHLPNSAFYYE